MKKRKQFANRALSVIMTMALLIGTFTFDIQRFQVQAVDDNMIDTSIEYKSPFDKVSALEKELSDGTVIPSSPVQAFSMFSAFSTSTGSDGTTNRDFIVPVTHKKTVPEEFTGIFNQDDLEAIGNNASGNYILMDDIYLIGNWTPILNFTGVFDGNGYVIRNMTIDNNVSNGRIGLFGSVYNATIKNLGVENTNINISNSSTLLIAGGIVAELRHSTIENCYNTGNIELPPSIIISGGSVIPIDAGGIAASIWNSTIKNCYNSGNVQGGWAGGIIGDMYNSQPFVSTIENCYNTGAINAIYAGGITSNICGHIRKSYNSGNVYGAYVAGGINGETRESTYSHKIENSYNTGNITGNTSLFADIGGISGELRSTAVLNCYNFSSVANNGGGIAGWSYGSQNSITNSYYYNIYSGAVGGGTTLSRSNVIALNDAAIRQEASFTGFDFDNIWSIEEDIGTPSLKSYSASYIEFAGIVTDGNTSAPIQDAEVIVRIWGRNSDTPYTFEASTDSAGQFSTWILPGTVDIRVNKRGYVSYSNGNDVVINNSTNNHVIELHRTPSNPDNLPTIPFMVTVRDRNTLNENDELGRAIESARVEIESWDSAGNSYISSGRTTRENGENISNFNAVIHPGEIKISVYAQGYTAEPYYNFSTRTDSWDNGHEYENKPYIISMLPANGAPIYVDLDIVRIPTDSVQESGMMRNQGNQGNQNQDDQGENLTSTSNLTFEAFNVTRNREIKDFRLSGMSIVFSNSSNKDGDIIKITITDNITGESVTKYYTIAIQDKNEVRFELKSLGGWTTIGGNASLENSVALLFNQDGQLINRYWSENSQITSNGLFAGDYTIVFAENHWRILQIEYLSQLNEFVENEEYIVREITITLGETTYVDLTGTNIPQCDVTKDYLDRDVTSITLGGLNGNKANINSPVSVNIRYGIANAYDDDEDGDYQDDKENIKVSNVIITIELPKGCVVVNGSIRLPSKDDIINISNGIITINTKISNGRIVFTMEPIEYDRHIISANLSFTYTEGKIPRTITRNIATTSFVTDRSIEIRNLPGRTDTSSYTVTGVTTPNTDVLVYVDGVEVLPTVQSNAVGSWSKVINLGLPGTYYVSAELIGIESELGTIKTSEYELIYQLDPPVVSTIRLGTRNYDNDFYGNLLLEKRNGEWYKGTSKIQPFSYTRYVSPWFSGTLREKISFEVTFTKKLPPNAVVQLVAYDNNEIVIGTVNLTYNSSSNMWVGNRDFPDSQLPQRISVTYDDVTGVYKRAESEKIRLSPYLDPSGFAYEAVASNRLSDVEATVWYRDGNEEKLWDAENNDQMNPIITSIDGMYAWDVPYGEWQVKLKKEGYDDANSVDIYGWLEVPPPQTEVHIGMVSTATPEIVGTNALGRYIEIEFSKYMDISTLNSSSVTLTGYSGEFDIVFPDAEVSPTDDSKTYARFMRFVPRTGGFRNNSTVSIVIGTDAKCYANVALSAVYSANLTVVGDDVLGGSVTGIVRSYNPKLETTITLVRDDKQEEYTTTIAAVNGSGQNNQMFTFDYVSAGTYTLTIKKGGHTDFIVQNVVVRQDDIDINSRVGVMTMTAGNINGGSTVTNADVTTVTSNLGKNVNNATTPLADVDGDGSVTATDLAIVKSNVGKGSVIIPY